MLLKELSDFNPTFGEKLAMFRVSGCNLGQNRHFSEKKYLENNHIGAYFFDMISLLGKNFGTWGRTIIPICKFDHLTNGG
jgi:hypothetical protein